jgi:tRNA A-37 threonylcarbamoyl transferase component Bud32
MEKENEKKSKGKKKYCHKHDHFKIVHKDYGHGARSKVSIVKRKSKNSDGKLLIWKQPLFDDRWHHESLRKEIKRAKLWRKFGVSRVRVCWHPDERSLLKTYIKGETLEQILKKSPGFFSRKSRHLKALREFIGFLIDSKHYIYDLIGENLVFDGKRWNIIDSGSVRSRNTRSETKQEYKQEFLKSWSKGFSSQEEINSLESFLDSVKPVKYRE